MASLIIALAINNGFRQDLQSRLLGSMSHVNVLRVESDGITNWRPLLDRLSKMPHVIAASPTIYDPVLISRGARAVIKRTGCVSDSSELQCGCVDRTRVRLA